MDWKAALTTFGVVFLAELGDKTQLTTITLAAKTRSPWSVFVGSALALTLVSLLGALLGGLVMRHVSATVLSRVSGALFIVLGAFMLLQKNH